MIAKGIRVRPDQWRFAVWHCVDCSSIAGCGCQVSRRRQQPGSWQRSQPCALTSGLQLFDQKVFVDFAEMDEGLHVTQLDNVGRGKRRQMRNVSWVLVFITGILQII